MTELVVEGIGWAAALLILKKKAEALWGDMDVDMTDENEH